MQTETPGAAQEPDWVREVLAFWFGELSGQQWFAGDPALDARIRARFGDLNARLAETGALGIEGARAMLAAVIVLDQFSRNIHRGEAQAFAGDASARRLARIAIDAGLDAVLDSRQRAFLYMPFQHSEDRADQALAVRLFSTLGNADWNRYALEHQRIVERFGRFPHRNAALGRESTPEELAFLSQPGSSF